MEVINSYSFSNMGIMVGRTMCYIFCSRNAMIAVTIIIMPIAFILLLVLIMGIIIQALEEIFLYSSAKK